MALTHDLPPLSESPVLLDLWPARYKDPALVTLQERIEEMVDEELDRRNPYSVDTRVVVHLKDGRQLRRGTDWVRDAPSHGTIWLRQLSDAEVEQKFRHLAGTVVSAERAEALCKAVRQVETMPDVRVLARLATPA
jgi:2-methylcitrate dehydratase PrpD